MASILIVDWDEWERVQFWSILEREGHELAFASDGQQALEYWEKKPADLVITELAVPELNGLRLIKALKEHDPDVRIIAVSLENADQLDLAEDFGASQILYKPITPKGVVEAVNAALDGYRRRKDTWR